MATWNSWEPAFMAVTLRDDGDPTEIEGATKFNLNRKFENYELFWRRHVVPATNRPANYDLRDAVSPEFAKLTATSHAVFCDIVEAERSLVRVMAGDYGGHRYETCQAVLTNGGNAIQKLSTLQRELVEPLIGRLAGRPVPVWTPTQWNTIWKPRRERLSAYRHFLIHNGPPQIMQVTQAGGGIVPYVPREDHFTTYESLSWSGQQARYGTHAFEWDEFKCVCQRVHDKAVAYVNDVYAEVLKLIDPFVTNEDYQDLWGWDTSRYGRQAARRAGVTGAGAGSHGSGSGFADAASIGSLPGGSGISLGACS